MRDYHKLIRDKIPEIIAAKGQAAVVHVATDDEFRQKALEKVVEEAEEVKAAGSADDRAELIKELADLAEILEAVKVSYQISEQEVEATRLNRLEERGGFAKRLILEKS